MDTPSTSIQAVRVEIQTLRAEVGADVGKVGDAVETRRAELHAIDRRLVRIETILDPESAAAEGQ